LNQKLISILFIITGLSRGGAERMLLKMLQQIDKEKFLPHVISLTDIGEIGIQIAALGIAVEALGMRQGPRDIICFFSLIQRIRQIRPDIVHTWMYHSDIIGGVAAKINRVPVIIWSVHSSNLLPNYPNLLTKIAVSLCIRLSPWIPDCVQYASNRAKDYHIKIGYRERFSLVIPNGVDLLEFKPNDQARQEVRQELGVTLETPLIGLVARFDPIKNHEGFIEAAGYLHDHMPDSHFVMVGQSVDWSNQFLKKQIVNNNLVEVFHLLGHRNDIPRITAALDLACLTSWSESFGIVLIEAMACGIPCVSTDCGEQALILGNKDWVVPIGDMKGLAIKIAEFLALTKNERITIGEVVRARVMEKYELCTVVEQYENLYLSFF
jgi:glycosyltransferase involved in cell wall biosynthesis